MKFFPFLSAMRKEKLKPLRRITKHIQGKKINILQKIAVLNFLLLAHPNFDNNPIFLRRWLVMFSIMSLNIVGYCLSIRSA